MYFLQLLSGRRWWLITYNTERAKKKITQAHYTDLISAELVEVGTSARTLRMAPRVYTFVFSDHPYHCPPLNWEEPVCERRPPKLRNAVNIWEKSSSESCTIKLLWVMTIEIKSLWSARKLLCPKLNKQQQSPHHWSRACAVNNNWALFFHGNCMFYGRWQNSLS